ncbi:hypothetical protein ACLOJK_030929 [Asimina triloba]
MTASLTLCLLLHVIILAPQSSILAFRNETDLQSLLAFKNWISSVDAFGALSAWNASLHFCEWPGITCSPRHERVAALSLESKGLAGRISPHIANLTFLREINLGDNRFYGEIPQELGRLSRLRYLNLSSNSLQGEIPVNITRCLELRRIDFLFNSLDGELPGELGLMPKLVTLRLAANMLTGRIPPSLGNLSSLAELSLARNRVQGSIPHELSRITNLEFFQVGANRLSGMVPPSIFNLSSIYLFAVADNDLVGGLPSNLGLAFPSLEMLLVGMNQFTGPIPVSLPNASRLTTIDFPVNSFTGPVPGNLGSLRELTRLSFALNQLGTDGNDDLGFISSLANCTNLVELGLHANRLKGVLTNSIANLSTNLRMINIGGNQIWGSIPAEIDSLVSLTLLGMQQNLLTGRIPPSIAKLKELRNLYLSSNKLSGEIPSSIGNLSLLNELYLGLNNLQGSIPSSLCNCKHLTLLDLFQNNLSGPIPKEILGLDSLSRFLNLGRNSLMGSIPVEVGSLINLQELVISENMLSGVIPGTLGNCQKLESLHLEFNSLEGSIPSSLNSLKAIQLLDLSHNKLSGQIPKYLGKLAFLQVLNLSFNDLEGEVPREGVFQNSSAISVLGNSRLCGGVPHLELPKCPAADSRRRQGRSDAFKVIIILVIIVSLSLFLLFSLFAALHQMRRTKKTPPAADGNSSIDVWYLKVSYTDLHRATDGFSQNNLIGVGSHGSVYRGTLDGMQVAVKVFNSQQQESSRSFAAECRVLRNVRHRNLVEILTSCSSIDYKADEFQALVYEFMSNGSLEDWLHSRMDGHHPFRRLSFLQRLNIAIDVACAMDYLHHQCQTPVIHCDLKPSNILLDGEMCAHVGDFGLAKLLPEITSNTHQNDAQSVAVRGSIGYVAPGSACDYDLFSFISSNLNYISAPPPGISPCPKTGQTETVSMHENAEYGMGGKVSERGDVYSYGIILLEMFTGKRPTHDMFEGGHSLRNFTMLALPDNVMEIVDPLLLLAEGAEEGDKRNAMKGCVVSVLEIGVACSAESPGERATMRNALIQMHAQGWAARWAGGGGIEDAKMGWLYKLATLPEASEDADEEDEEVVVAAEEIGPDHPFEVGVARQQVAVEENGGDGRHRPVHKAAHEPNHRPKKQRQKRLRMHRMKNKPNQTKLNAAAAAALQH